MNLTLLEILHKYQIKLEPLGTKFTTNCPFPDHNDKTPSWVVYPETNSFYCFGCHKVGGPVEFLMFYEKISREEAQKRFGTQDIVEDIERLLKSPTLAEHDFNNEVNFVISGLVREKLQKGTKWETLVGPLRKFDTRLATEKLNEQQAKEIIDQFQKTLNGP